MDARKSDQGDITKSPPVGFYPLSTSRSEQKEAEDLALMNVACHFTGLRWIDSGPNGRRKPAWCTKFESLTQTSHFDQVWRDRKCKLREMNRTFEIHMVTADLPTQDLVRLIMSELQDRQIGTTRVTVIWPRRPPPNEDFGPAKIIVVVQSRRSTGRGFDLPPKREIQSLFLEKPRAPMPRAQTREAPQCEEN